jgi:hypothetical protein
MYIRELSIRGVGGIASFDLALNRYMNILCGPNGIGKTTILDCIAHLFALGATRGLRRSALAERGEVTGVIEFESGVRTHQLNLTEFVPNKEAQIQPSHDQEASRDLLVLKVGRTLEYQALDAVRRDSEKQIHELWNDARKGVVIADVKNWFVNRYLYSAHGTLTDSQLANYTLAKSAFGLLDASYSFSRVDPRTNEIMVSGPTGEIYYEYLSSGFKSVLAIVFGIIKEIEYRYSDKGIEAARFGGMILIDEVELHLHPEWQSQITSVLRACFPQAQFICTTHSPHVIQAAEANEIVALGGVGGELVKRSLASSSAGFKGWTVEEVLVEVMGMRDVMTESFNEVLSCFEAAVDAEDVEAARAGYRRLNDMLHPGSKLRKLIRMQFIAAGGDA